VKEDVAKKFMGIMENLGVYKFDRDDFATQEGIESKLDFVKNSIKKIKNNIKELNQVPTSSFNPGDFRKSINSNFRSYPVNNDDLFAENSNLKLHLRSTEEQEIDLTRKFENAMRSPVKDLNHERI
jgi:hypothetical protein